MTTNYDYIDDEPYFIECGGKEIGVTGKWTVEIEFEEDDDGVQDIWINEILDEEITAQDEDCNKYSEDEFDVERYMKWAFDRLKESFLKDYEERNLLYEVTV